MNILFSASEIVSMAIEAEKNGLDFYQAMAAKTDNEKIKAVFSFLADEEAQHEKTFQTLLENISLVKPSHAEEAENNSYLTALASSRLFTSGKKMDELVRGISDDLEALDVAINSEKESILLYYELREYTKDEGLENVDLILKEEKMHLAKLTKLKLELTKIKNS